MTVRLLEVGEFMEGNSFADFSKEISEVGDVLIKVVEVDLNEYFFIFDGQYF